MGSSNHQDWFVILRTTLPNVSPDSSAKIRAQSAYPNILTLRSRGITEGWFNALSVCHTTIQSLTSAFPLSRKKRSRIPNGHRRESSAHPVNKVVHQPFSIH